MNRPENIQIRRTLRPARHQRQCCYQNVLPHLKFPFSDERAKPQIPIRILNYDSRSQWGIRVTGRQKSGGQFVVERHQESLCARPEPAREVDTAEQ